MLERTVVVGFKPLEELLQQCICLENSVSSKNSVLFFASVQRGNTQSHINFWVHKRSYELSPYFLYSQNNTINLCAAWFFYPTFSFNAFKTSQKVV